MAGDRAGDGGGFFTEVYAVVRGIPEGRVATYGQVARLLGVARGARAVGWALRALGAQREPQVPWHRVVGAGGRISLRPDRGGAEQVARLRSEGVGLREGRVDLGRYGLELGATRGKPARRRASSTASRRRASSRAAGSTRP